MMNLLSRLQGISFSSPVSIRLGLWGLIFALIAALGYTGGSISSLILAVRIESLAVKPTSAPAEAPVVRQRKPMATFDPILTANIFHARRSSPDYQPSGNFNSPSSLRLTLTGTFIVGKVAFAFIVGPDGRTEQVYQLGDCVPRTTEEPTQTCGGGQGKLSRVAPDHIVVALGDQNATYNLEQGAAEQPEQPAPRPPKPQPGPNPSAAVLPPGSLFPSSRSGNTIETRIPSAEVSKAFENFAEITKQAQVVPYTADGNTIGFQIRKIAPGSVFNRIGLQDSDIITGVNGASVTTADQALRLFTMFRNEREIVMDIQRGGEILKLSYTIE